MDREDGTMAPRAHGVRRLQRRCGRHVDGSRGPRGRGRRRVLHRREGGRERRCPDGKPTAKSPRHEADEAPHPTTTRPRARVPFVSLPCIVERGHEPRPLMTLASPRILPRNECVPNPMLCNRPRSFSRRSRPITAARAAPRLVRAHVRNKGEDRQGTGNVIGTCDVEHGALAVSERPSGVARPHLLQRRTAQHRARRTSRGDGNASTSTADAKLCCHRDEDAAERAADPVESECATVREKENARRTSTHAKEHVNVSNGS